MFHGGTDIDKYRLRIFVKRFIGLFWRQSFGVIVGAFCGQALLLTVSLAAENPNFGIDSMVFAGAPIALALVSPDRR